MNKHRLLALTLLALTAAPAACQGLPATIVQCRIIASETVPFPYPHDGTSSFGWDLSLNIGQWDFPDGSQGFSEVEDSTIWSDPHCVNSMDPYSDAPNPYLAQATR